MKSIVAGFALLALVAACSGSDSGVTAPQKITTGSLNVSVNGLPANVAAAASISGPNGFSRSIDGPTTLTGLAVGTYTITADIVRTGGYSYAVPSSPISVSVAASATPVETVLSYGLATGALRLTSQGLPVGTAATVDVSGPNGFHVTAPFGATLTDLAPGTYTLVGGSIAAGGDTYGAAAPVQATVAASLEPTAVSLAYAQLTGHIALTITGLPTGFDASVTVSGPGGFTSSVTSTQSLTNLAPGTYAVGASSLLNGATAYVPSPTTQNVTVAAGASAPVTVAYATSVAGADLTIAGMYITQVVQTLAGTVPLVAGKTGLIRVFVTASQANSLQPTVRVRFYNGSAVVNSLTINASASSVPTTVSEEVLTSSWNGVVPGAWLQPGISVVADVDPTNAYFEPNEANNAFPASGTPAALNVQAVSTLNLRFVPVSISANGATGDVSLANKDQFLAQMQKMYPVSSIDADLRATYTTSAPPLQSGDGNGAWGQILSEVNALRTADASPRLYYGVVHANYSSGVAGLGYVPGSTAIGWDYLPSGANVIAHEVGHNFGRWHAPCGNPAQVDQQYPYPGGTIGVTGYDATTNTLRATTTADLMGYCSSSWISDYNYVGILNYRGGSQSGISEAVSGGGTVSPSLLVWGRIHSGELTLEPVYDIDARPSMPVRAGANLIEAFGEDGQRLLSFSFDGERIADGNDATDQTFAFAVPRSALDGHALARLRLSALGRTTELRAGAAAADPAFRSNAGAPVAAREGRDMVRVSWRDANIRGVLVRDARTGDILTFGKGGEALVRTPNADVEITASNGVRSQRWRVVPK